MAMELWGVSLSAWTGQLAGNERGIDLHKTKGLMGMATEGLTRPAGSLHPSPCTTPPAPNSYFSMS